MASELTRTLFQLEVLSNGPLEAPSLRELAEACTTGPCSGCLKVAAEEVVDPRTMARLLINQGSDPEFLLDEGDPLAGTWDENHSRPVEFLVVHEDGSWDLFIESVPVEVRWDGLQKWAADALAATVELFGQSSTSWLAVIPWSENPHG